jgi:hypothetical protein
LWWEREGGEGREETARGRNVEWEMGFHKEDMTEQGPMKRNEEEEERWYTETRERMEEEGKEEAQGGGIRERRRYGTFNQEFYHQINKG